MRALVLCLLLSGCGLFQSGGPSEVSLQAAQVPLLPVIHVERPVLKIHQVSESGEADVLVKAYVATVSQLIDYAEALELIIDQLQMLHIEEYTP